jgi:hypothetical protein
MNAFLSTCSSFWLMDIVLGGFWSLTGEGCLSLLNFESEPVMKELLF